MSKRKDRKRNYLQFFLLTAFLVLVSIALSLFISFIQTILEFDVLIKYFGILLQISGIILLFFILESAVNEAGNKKYIMRPKSGNFNLNNGNSATNENNLTKSSLENKVQKLEKEFIKKLKYLNDIDKKVEELYENFYSEENYNKNWFIDFLKKGYDIEIKSISLVLAGIVLSSLNSELANLSIFLMDLLQSVE